MPNDESLRRVSRKLLVTVVAVGDDGRRRPWHWSAGRGVDARHATPCRRPRSTQEWPESWQSDCASEPTSGCTTRGRIEARFAKRLRRLRGLGGGGQGRRSHVARRGAGDHITHVRLARAGPSTRSTGRECDGGQGRRARRAPRWCGRSRTTRRRADGGPGQGQGRTSGQGRPDRGAAAAKAAAAKAAATKATAAKAGAPTKPRAPSRRPRPPRPRCHHDPDHRRPRPPRLRPATPPTASTTTSRVDRGDAERRTVR